MHINVAEIARQVKAAAEELLEIAQLKSGQILIIGCSTSEVRGAKIGSLGSEEIAESILNALVEVCARDEVRLAIQCCEHLNRALVVTRSTMDEYRLQEVSVMPVAKAGGSLAACAMRMVEDAVVVEELAAHAGLDIGNTMVGMHLKKVAVPVRLQQQTVGHAPVVAARTRPKLIGGERAVYRC
jgi:uncharacterized protein (TIGR01440 family)